MSNLGSSQLVFLLSEVNKNLTYTFILFLKTLVQIPKKIKRERERERETTSLLKKNYHVLLTSLRLVSLKLSKL